MAPPKTGEHRNCLHCGARYYARPSDDRRGRRKYCSSRCQHDTYRGDGNPNWRGGEGFVSSSGYRMIRLPDHPQADNAGYYEEHRHVVEQQIGRQLEITECVHHINHDRLDNRPENLQLMTSWAEHQIAHAEYRDEPCAWCGSSVRRSKAHRRRWARAYCSRACAAAAGSKANAERSAQR